MEQNIRQGRPFGFYICSIAYSFERFSFYSAKWLMTIFIATSVANGGLGLDDTVGALASSRLVAFTYLGPLIGGYISDHWVGARYLIPVGMLLMAGAYLVGWQATSLDMIWLMIILMSIGTALFKSQNSAITSRLFNNRKELDGAFSTQYSFINLGSFIGTTVIGVIAGMYNYRICFLICAIMMVINTVWFIFGYQFLGDAGKKPFKVDENAQSDIDNEIEKKPFTKLEKNRIMAIVMISIFAIVFWIFWYLAYMPVYFYWAKEGAPAANWIIGNFKIPTAWFDSLNALCCIVMGPILGAYWIKRANSRKGDWNMFQKAGLSMFLLGIAYVIFVVADIVKGTGQASILWIVAFGIILTLGEMVFSPLGNAFVAKYAPARILSIMMSVWVLSVFFAGLSYGPIYAYTKKFNFTTAYSVVAAISISIGLIIWIFSGKLNKLVEGDE